MLDEYFARLGFSLCCAALWWHGAFALARRQRQILSVSGNERGSSKLRVVNLLLWGLLTAPLLMAGFLWLGSDPAGRVAPLVENSSGLAFGLSMAELFAPVALSQLLGGWLLGGQRVPGVEAPSRKQRWMVFFTILPFVAIMNSLAVGWLASIAGRGSTPLTIGLVAICVLAIIPLQFLGGLVVQARPEGLQELDGETPLNAEIRHMAALAGIEELRAIRLQPLKKKAQNAPDSNEPYKFQQRFLVWWRSFKPAHPVIPLELLRKAPSSDALTSALAFHYAIFKLRHPKGPPGKVAQAFLAVGVLLAVFGTALAMAGWQANLFPVLLTGLGCMAASLPMGAWRGVRGAWAGLRAQHRAATYRLAFEIWRDAEPSENRDELAYLRATAQFNRTISQNVEKAKLVDFLANMNGGIAGFIDEAGREQAIAVMRQAVEEME